MLHTLYIILNMTWANSSDSCCNWDSAPAKMSRDIKNITRAVTSLYSFMKLIPKIL